MVVVMVVIVKMSAGMCIQNARVCTLFGVNPKY